MTSVFSADGKNVPCTVIEAGPCVVTQVKTVEKDGYAAVQLAFGEAKATGRNAATKPMQGIFKKANTTPKKHLAEFKFDEEHNLGDTITVELFKEDDFVDVVGTSKGKGFQGVVKRHGFGGVGQSTHGQDYRCLLLSRYCVQGTSHGRPNGRRPCDNPEPESVKGNSGAQPPCSKGQRCRMHWFNFID